MNLPTAPRILSKLSKDGKFHIQNVEKCRALEPASPVLSFLNNTGISFNY